MSQRERVCEVMKERGKEGAKKVTEREGEGRREEEEEAMKNSGDVKEKEEEEMK